MSAQGEQGAIRPFDSIVPRLIAPLRETFRRLPPLDAMLYLTGRALAAATFGHCRLVKYYFMAQPIAPGGAGADRRGAIAVRIVAPDDPVVKRFPRPPQIIARRFAAGAQAFVAEIHGRFAGFLWLQQWSYDEDEVRCRYVPWPPQHTVWDFDVHVEPEFRMGRAFSKLWDAANRHLRERGVRWSMSRISAFNPESLRAHARLGSAPIGSAVFVTLGPWQAAWLSEKPFIHVALSAAAHPTIRLVAPMARGEAVRAAEGQD